MVYVHVELAEYEAARAKYEAARPIYAGIGDRLGEANTNQSKGAEHLKIDEKEAARAKCEEAGGDHSTSGSCMAATFSRSSWR